MKALLIVLTALLMPVAALAGEFALHWDANPESNLAGYKIYYGSDYRTYDAPDSPIDVGNSTSHEMSLNAGIYHFAVTAYDTEGNESGYSYEVVLDVPVATVRGLRSPD